MMPAGAPVPVVLMRAPGTKDWSTAGTGSIKGMWRAKINFATGRLDRLYAVSGRELYSLDSAGAATLIGDIGTPGNLDFASNDSALVIVNEPRAWSFDGRLYTGTHTAAGNNATVMTDSSATFTPDQLIGATIFNETDGSQGTITDNDQTSVTVLSLSGGTDNDWDTSDVYRISSFAEIVDSDFTSRGAGNVEFLENFLLFREPNSNRMFGADLGSSTDFDSLSFVNADSHTDYLRGIQSNNRNLICFGEDSTEFFTNTGAAGFPFERIINGTIEVGLAAENLYGQCFDVVYFIADDLTVRRLDGNQPAKVSTHYIEQLLEKTFTLDSGEAFSYWQEGHFFIGFTFIEGTILYDAVTQEWHERKSFNREYWRFRNMVRFAGKTLAGDRDSNEIVELDTLTFDEAVNDPTMASNVQVMEWTYQPIYANGVRAFHDRLEVRFESGVGLTTGQGSDPVMMMQFSDDGGRTWIALPTKTLGKKGEYQDRAVWYNLGSSRQRVYKGSISDPVKVYIGQTITEVRGGRL